jgi:signal transduction histidine kinase/HAMP domain-containing protein
MKWWQRLSCRLTIIILFLAIVPLVGFGIFTIKDIRQVRLQSVEQIHRGIAESSVLQIESSLTDTIAKIQLVIESNELEGAKVFDQEWILQLLIKDIPHLYTLTIAETSGREKVKVGRDTVFSQKNLATHTDYPDFKKNMDITPIIGTLHSNHSSFLILDLYIPLVSPMERQVTAVLAVEIDINKLLDFTADVRVGQTGYVYVVDPKGKFLVHPDHSVVLAGEDARHNPLVQDFIFGRKVFDANKIYTNRQQVEVLTNARALKEPRLLIVVVQSTTEAMAAVAKITTRQAVILMLVLAAAIFLSFFFTVKISKSLNHLASGAELIGAGQLSHRIPVRSADELGTVTCAFNTMAAELEAVRKTAEQQNWLKQGVATLDRLLRGELSVEKICSIVITYMADYLKARVGLVCVHDGQGRFRPAAGYALAPGSERSEGFHLGEGLAGQAALGKKIIEVSHIPSGYISVTSTVGRMDPRHLSIVPFIFNDQAEAVMELGFLKEPTQMEKRFLAETADSIAIIIAAARSRQELKKSLVHTQKQAEELTQQQEELQAANEELEEQTQMLTASESRLKEQQEELQAANEELEEKTEYLERNKKNIEKKNQVLQQLRRDLEKKAEDLAVASKYKSEFLANMSHELRTPLNSMLLLSRLLADNKDGRLSEEQVESAAIIHNSGNDLLSLINEILDLSKIEAGKMQLSMDEILLIELRDDLDKSFRPLAEKKGLTLDFSIKDGAPAAIVSDRQRVVQILNNFMANAFKFTAYGGVFVKFYQPDDTVILTRHDLAAQNALAIEVRDTGIGIAPDKKQIIFEAFQQLEGGSARKYGGTGLGLSISRELAQAFGWRDRAAKPGKCRLHLHSFFAPRSCGAGRYPA